MGASVRRLLPAAVFLAAGLAIAAWSTRDGGGAVTPAVVEGTPAVAAQGDAPIPARPRPDTPPETVGANGGCRDAMEALRALVAAVPSGSLLDEGQNRVLTDGLATVDAACPPALAAAFREREIVPWLTWAPPAGAER